MICLYFIIVIVVNDDGDTKLLDAFDIVLTCCENINLHVVFLFHGNVFIYNVSKKSDLAN